MIRITHDSGDFPLVGTPTPVDGIAEAHGPRWAVLDRLLVDAAVEAGVEFREGFAVDELPADGDTVTGIRGRSSGQAGSLARPRGGRADGKHSVVARSADAPVYAAQPWLTCWYWSYWSDAPVDGTEIYWRDGRLILASPTNDRLTCVVVGYKRGT